MLRAEVEEVGVRFIEKFSITIVMICEFFLSQSIRYLRYTLVLHGADQRSVSPPSIRAY